jgi:hypothetical protein
VAEARRESQQRVHVENWCPLRYALGMILGSYGISLVVRLARVAKNTGLGETRWWRSMTQKVGMGDEEKLLQGAGFPLRVRLRATKSPRSHAGLEASKPPSHLFCRSLHKCGHELHTKRERLPSPNLLVCMQVYSSCILYDSSASFPWAPTGLRGRRSRSLFQVGNIYRQNRSRTGHFPLQVQCKSN